MALRTFHAQFCVQYTDANNALEYNTHSGKQVLKKIDNLMVIKAVKITLEGKILLIKDNDTSKCIQLEQDNTEPSTNNQVAWLNLKSIKLTIYDVCARVLEDALILINY